MSPPPIPSPSSSVPTVGDMVRAAWLHRVLAPIAAVMVLLCLPALAGGASAPRSQSASEAPLFIPGAFRLPASNGYTLNVLAVPPWAGRPGSLLMSATAKAGGPITESRRR
jgi:hypothetical protein